MATDNLSSGQVLTISRADYPVANHSESSQPEGAPSTAATHVKTNVSVDIEHLPVEDDPRAWSPLRKNGTLVLIAFASMIAALSGNIQNPAVQQMEAELPATSSQFSLSIAIFVLLQGIVPLLWTAVSEVKGRKFVYVISIALFTIASVVVALSHGVGSVIGLRALQAAGSSAVIGVGAVSLADIFDPHERGRKMGIYYAAPLLGPAIGPILGGFLTAVWDWRAIFWFLTIFGGSIFISFIIFFKDTFRKERSLVYQNILKQRLQDPTQPHSSKLSGSSVTEGTSKRDGDVEKNPQDPSSDSLDSQLMPDIKLSITDLDLVRPLGVVLRRKNNLLVLVCSGIQFAYAYMIAYATSRTLGTSYNYGPLKIGLVTLSFGVGCVFGSVVGGRWSDRELARLKAANNGQSYPEMRLKSTTLGLLLLPPCVVSYGWLCQQKVHISAICIFLFLGGFFSIWMYAITLAYIVDSNTGRSSSAVALNSAFRGIFAFVATEIVVPLQDGLGDGWLYTIMAGILALSGTGMFLLTYKGSKWRTAAELREMRQQDVKSTAVS